MQYTVNAGTFDFLWELMVLTFSQTAVTLVLYGVYLILFVLSLYALSCRKAAGTTLLIVASCTMAVLASTQMALAVALTARFGRVTQEIVHNQFLAADLKNAARLDVAVKSVFVINK
ncbi:hypothetical protein MSAN_02100200 [Mycena sanguinolenta]|uniref:Uncharacterized protein n=1 Tax=Mycena sanguinolenta TaxID=230812 RepID=A0A8H7CK65_9AGAR|nr:hypothetical protein MSAN_02100200 [Mycena sanguinolenta]